MNTLMPIGREDFADVRSGYYFVDKTTFLQAFLKNHAIVTLFTRPRRFGKTLTLSMMRYFLDLEDAKAHRKLFDGLMISKDTEAMKLQGSRPVLLLTLKGWKADSWEEMKRVISDMLSQVFDARGFLLSGKDVTEQERLRFEKLRRGEADLIVCRSAIAFLLRMLEKYYGKKPVLLMDEYDVPVQAAWEHQYYKEAIGFFRELFSSALKSNPSLDFAVLTGVLRIPKENIFSALNNLSVDSVFHLKYPEAFGFTTEEIKKITRDFRQEDKLPEIRRWYDGYRFAGREIYNPWSVINYFDSGCTPQPYWVNTSGNSSLGGMLLHSRSRVLEKLETVLQGEAIETRVREDLIYSGIYKNESALYTMLVTTGYLTTRCIKQDDIGMRAEIILPNRELQSLFRSEVLDRYHSEDMDIEVTDLMRAFADGDIETVRDGLGEYLEVLTSTFDAQKGQESFYHGFVLGLTATLTGDYQIRSNRESGYGRYDIAAFPREVGRHGFVIECKTAENEEALEAGAQAALHQIVAKDYDAEFRARGVEEGLHYGVAFCGKRVHVESV